MARIHILPETLSNQIAAGEVVERPASAVKELVENALDAGAGKISVAIEQGGRSLIRVSDDGQGMSKDDALLCLERYATSKITDQKSLFAIRTLGFRGEALPSIASVSDFSLITRLPEADEATEISVSGGKIKDVKETGAPPGTMVTVRRLFFNTPVRRKFLKTMATEMAHIGDTMAAFALCHPEVYFQLSHNGKTVKNWPRTDDARQRTADVLGPETRDHLHALDHTAGDLKVTGWLSSPQISRATSQKIYLFVNGRTIRDRGLQHALFEGYRGRLIKGAFPLAAIFISLPFDQVDVNVHPTKTEVRFVDPKRLYHLLQKAVAGVWENLAAPPWRPAATVATADFTPADRSATGSGYPPWETSPAAAGGTAEPVAAYAAAQQKLWPEKSVTPLPEPASFPPPPDPEPGPAAAPEAAPSGEGLSSEGAFFSGLTVVGQLHGTYILGETETDLILIDQHAAHERIVFEALKKREKQRGATRQALLIPETVELNFQEAAQLEAMRKEFSQLGLEIEPFGQNTMVIKAVPEILSAVAVGPMVRELAEKMCAGGPPPDLTGQTDACLQIMACHAAIRARQSLSHQEMTALLRQLDACENPWHCPHGRPTSINWSVRDMAKAFRRII